MTSSRLGIFIIVVIIIIIVNGTYDTFTNILSTLVYRNRAYEITLTAFLNLSGTCSNNFRDYTKVWSHCL